MSRKNRKIFDSRATRKNRGGGSAFLLISLGAVICSFAIAGVWQVFDAGAYVAPESSSQTSSESSSSQPPEQQEIGSSAESEPAPQPSESLGSVPTEGTLTAVPKSEWVSSDYFDDALFIGDSLTEGIKLYDVMSNTTVLSYTGINLNSIFTKQVIDTPAGKTTIMEAAKGYDPGKIYILMGVNSMYSDEATFVADYGRVVDELKNQHPGALIYVQSILPVTETYAANNPAFSNEKIDSYNLALSQMTVEKEVYFVNVAEALKNENGALPTEASPKDGIHFGRNYYMQWFDYLRTHTIATA